MSVCVCALCKLNHHVATMHCTRLNHFRQVFNPSWIEASPGTHGKAGLIIRTQNCSAGDGCYCVGCKCCGCGGSGPLASILTFAELETDDETPFVTPKFKYVDNSSVVFAPIDKSDYR